jgi:hypothetical protein
MNHGNAAMRIAFAARLHARLTSDTAAGIDEKLKIRGNGHGGILPFSAVRIKRQKDKGKRQK